MKQVGLLLGEDTHHLDHLAPLCSLLSIPLATDSKAVADLVPTFYPELTLIYKDKSELPLFLVNTYEQIISSIAKPLVDLYLFPHAEMMGKTMHTLWCPHGYSDKGKTIPFFEALESEEGLLYYGPKMLATLKEKVNGLEHKTLFCIGNYRRAYFDARSAFYKKLLDSKLRFKHPNRQTLLYAPSWKDSENASGVEKVLPKLLELVPDELNVIVKLHPNTLKKGALLDTPLLQKGNIALAHDIPTIWPLLMRADLFLGDMSSVGYDCLGAHKPMFFLLHPQCHLSKHSALIKCGYQLKIDQLPTFFNQMDTFIKKADHLEKEKQILYNEVFGSVSKLSPLTCEAPL